MVGSGGVEHRPSASPLLLAAPDLITDQKGIPDVSKQNGSSLLSRLQELDSLHFKRRYSPVLPVSLDSSVKGGRKLELKLSPKKSFFASEQSDKSGQTSRRARRFYQRFFTGAFVGRTSADPRGGRLRFLTLTSSDQAVIEQLDIHKSWTKLKKRIRRAWGSFEYIAVKEHKGDRIHVHMVFRGPFIPQDWIEKAWLDIHHSIIVKIETVDKKRKRGMGWELAKYLSKECCHYWQSYGWVFEGWVGWSRYVRKVTKNFPSMPILRTLARMFKEERKRVIDFLMSGVYAKMPFDIDLRYVFQNTS